MEHPEGRDADPALDRFVDQLAELADQGDVLPRSSGQASSATLLDLFAPSTGT